ncbi:restriction endonuclease subunit S [Endozoicomonas sp. ALB115]|uniref:restriction endonuclease subunit S n=1 Tax=Endozoicomonas sp. ALB115 TaxID=3403074 RepID=UPI003BB7EACB
MEKLPKGWIKTTLENIAIWGAGGTPKRTVDTYYGGDIPWIKTGDLGPKWLSTSSETITQSGLENSSAKFFNKGAVAIAMYGATIGKTSILGIKAATNQACAVGQPLAGVTSSKFLYYLLNNEKQRFIDKSKGGAQPNISQAVIRRHEVYLPCLAEQERIVEKLEDLLGQVATTQARLDQLPTIIKQFRQSVLAAAVTGQLTEEWRSSNEYQTVYGKKIPCSWTIEPAEKACLRVQSGSTPRNNPFEQGGTVPFLKVYNIVDQKIDFAYRPQYITLEVSEKSDRSATIPGDILMNIVGPPLGKIAIVSDQHPKWHINQAITSFRVNPKKLLNTYLYYFLCEGDLVRDVMHETKGIVGQINISLTQCREALVPLPPIPEQEEIVKKVSEYFALADVLESNLKNAKAQVDNLSQSILAKAFRGELVDQQEGGESAEVLLQKIAEARVEAELLEKATKKATRGRKTAKA